MRNSLIYLNFILLCTCTDLACCKRLQMFTLYDDTGQSENYTTNIPDLTVVSNLIDSETLTSVCSQVGVWAFFSTKNYTDQHAYGYHPATPDWTCNSRRIGADHGFAAVNSIRHLGSADLDISAISLYSEPYFANNELYFDGEIISLPLTYTFYSYGFTGIDSWTLYASTNFSGATNCLRRNSSDNSGVTYNTDRKLVVGSIVRGCFRTPRLLPISEVLPENVPNIRNETVQKKPIKSHQCIELQDFLNASISVFSGNEIRFPEPEPYDSFTIQMNSTWTIYTGTDFNGDAMCLKIDPSEMNPRKQALNYQFVQAPHLIGSIRQGCIEQLKNPAQNLTDLRRSDLTKAITTLKPNILSANQNKTIKINSTQSSSTSSTVSSIMMPKSGHNNLFSTSLPPSSNLTEPQTQVTHVNEVDSKTYPQMTTDSTSRQNQTNVTFATILPESTTNSTNIKTQNATSSVLSISNETTTISTIFNSNQSTLTNSGELPNSAENLDDQTVTPTATTEDETEYSTNSDLLETGFVLYTTSREEAFTRRGKELNLKSVNGEALNERGQETSTNFMISESKEDLTSYSTSTKSTITLEPNMTSSSAASNQSLENATIKPEELVSKSGTGSLFFTAFIVVLGLLILCMLITLGLFVYFRASRHRNNDEVPT